MDIVNGRTTPNRSTAAVLSVAALALCAGAAFARPAAPKAAPRPPARGVAAGVMPMLKAIAAAANKGEVHKMWPYATAGRGEVFPWARGGGMMSKLFQPDPWAPALLEAPFSNGTAPLAVFSTWHAPESDGDHIHPLVRTAQGWRVAPEISERDTQGYRIRHHDMAVAINPAKRTAAIVDTFDIERTVNAKPAVFLRLSSDFRVRSLSSNGKYVPFRQAGGVVAVRVPPGDVVRMRMSYDGRVVHKAISSIEPNYALLNAYYWPSLGRLPATSVTRITVPKGWTAVTQGDLAGQSDAAATTTFRYVNKVPANYLSLAAGKYRETKRQAGDVTLYAYLLGAQAGFAETVLDSLEQALPYFEKRYGPFPFKRYSVMDGGTVMGFMALEGYSMATYGTVTLTPMVVSHELAHTWWGGIVPNTYLRSWWNEAFASYSDDAFLRMKNKVEARHPTDRPWWPAFASVSSAPLASARHTDQIDAIAYRKGMVVLRLLEDHAGGEEAFDRILQAFVRENSGRPDPGWPDFQRSVERVTGRKWGWFFDQWVNRPGWPGLRLESAKVQTLPNGERRVTAHLAQDAPAYRLRIPVRLETDGEPVDIIVDTAAGPQNPKDMNVVVSTRDRPVRLVIDPEFDIPRRFGLDDVVTFDEDGQATYAHSREEQAGMPF